jgi:enoyl reductase-like protein
MVDEPNEQEEEVDDSIPEDTEEGAGEVEQTQSGEVKHVAEPEPWRSAMSEMATGLSTEWRAAIKELQTEIRNHARRYEQQQTRVPVRQDAPVSRNKWADPKAWHEANLDPEFRDFLTENFNMSQKKIDELTQRLENKERQDKQTQDGVRIEQHLRTESAKAMAEAKIPEIFKNNFEEKIIAKAFLGEDPMTLDFVKLAKDFVANIQRYVTESEAEKMAAAKANGAKPKTVVKTGGGTVIPGDAKKKFLGKDELFASIRKVAEDFASRDQEE